MVSSSYPIRTNDSPLNAVETRQSFARYAPTLRNLGCALLVAIGYCLGTQIGFQLTPRARPISTFWPPNAILLAAFLLTPPRKWWTLLLAVFPAHMLPQLHTGVPVWTAVGWFVTNCSEALLGAFCITRLIDPKEELDSIRGIITFVTFGVVIAPLASSFLDAASVVITRWGRGYWTLGVERFWSNALAELTIVPIVVLGASRGATWLRKAKRARVGEAAVLAIGTMSLAFLIGLQPGWLISAPGLLYLALPFFLWAAARFGLAGLSFSVWATALTSLWYTMHGREPFPNASLAQNILSLQILYCTAVVPLMFLSAVMKETRRTQESLRQASIRLIAAQEQERHRIARELHDDLGQRLALLSVHLKEVLGNPDSCQKPTVSDLVNQVEVIALTTRDISHGLYPSQLEYLGLASAVKRLCDDVDRGRKVSISLMIATLPSELEPSVSLCIYRVLQEALQNIIRHSHAGKVHVALTMEKMRIVLTITDDGIGFDAKQNANGLGVLSMRQRVESLGGDIDIASGGNTGTRIHVQLPLQRQHLRDND